MKPRSAKAKGRKAQNEVKQLILETFDNLEEDDVKPALMSEAGADIKLSPAAKKIFPYSVEVKNVEKLNVWSALEQAEKNCAPGTTPALFFTRNRTKTYVAIPVEQFMEMAKIVYNTKSIDKE